ncbi:hypothetical protein NMY22_g18491 [Coprinellus aureogranulatus]|nr:hypothetical protein NMY22_g18491 [Coprinellus aureogranulatus]
MPRCPGCSRNYPALLQDTRCGRCKVKQPQAHIEDWGACKHCGSLYEHLEGDICFVCGDAEDGLVQAARNAIANPVNPRAHTGPDGRASLASRVHEQAPDVDQERREYANRILSHMGGGYADAVSRATPGVRIAPSKLKGGTGSGIPKPVTLLNIKISKVTDHDKGKYRTGPTFHSISTQLPADRAASELAAMCYTIADNAYTKYKDRRVAEDGFTLLWTASKTILDPEWLAEGQTIGDVWRRASNNTLLVPTSDVKRKVMDFHVVVLEETESDVENFGDESKGKTYLTRKGKRANSVGTADLHAKSQASAPSDSNMSKKPRVQVAAAGRNAYTTTINRTPGTMYTVHKAGYVEGSDGTFTWAEEDVPIKVFVEAKPFASGLTKNAYKMSISGVAHAAKNFYDLGDETGEDVSKEDNLSYLKEELLCQQLALKSVRRFMDGAREAKVSVYNLKAAEPFIVIVTEGPNKGQAWTADLLISECASVHCAAVFVDIQGIDSDKLPLTAKKGPTTGHFLYMFDFMMHSASGTQGLGDEGWYGIETFVGQHKCNDYGVREGHGSFRNSFSRASGSDDVAMPAIPDGR